MPIESNWQLATGNRQKTSRVARTKQQRAIVNCKK